MLLGLVAVPGLFCWFLLRRGYSNTLRVAAFSLAAFGLLQGLVRELSP